MICDGFLGLVTVEITPNMPHARWSTLQDDET